VETKLTESEQAATAAARRGYEKLHYLGQDVLSVDRRKLNLEDPARCMLGQLYGEFDDGLRRVFPLEDDVEELERLGMEYGFIAPWLDSSPVKYDYGDLTAAWHRVLNEVAELAELPEAPKSRRRLFAGRTRTGC
jgi:hypothetical protein